MKKTFARTWIVLGMLALPANAVLAQDSPVYAPIEDAAPVSTPEASVVYTAPVVYQAPVIYQQPVVYYAPVYYVAPDVPACPPPSPGAKLSTVFVINAHGGSYGYGHSGCRTPSLVYFGRSGGWFGGRQ